MVDPKLIAMLRCPVDGSELKLADDSLVSIVNSAIDRGDLRDRQDQRIGETIQHGLVTADGQRLYPVRQGIPALVADEAINIGSLPSR